jgi:hypothetical protein
MWFYQSRGVPAFFLPLPAWLGCALLYVLFSRLLNPRPALRVEI